MDNGIVTVLILRSSKSKATHVCSRLGLRLVLNFDDELSRKIGERRIKKMHGVHVRTVFWKHDVKIGFSTSIIEEFLEINNIGTKNSIIICKFNS